MPPRIGFVQYVIMNQRRGVDHLNDGTEYEMVVGQRSYCRAGEQQHRGAEPLSAQLRAVAEDGDKGLVGTLQFRSEPPFDIGKGSNNGAVKTLEGAPRLIIGLGSRR